MPREDGGERREVLVVADHGAEVGVGGQRLLGGDSIDSGHFSGYYFALLN